MDSGKWSIVCKKVPLKLNGKFYKTVVKSAMMCGSDCLAINTKKPKMKVAEMRSKMHML